MNYHKVYMNHVHSSSLLTQLATMWKSQTLCDAVIRTGNIITKAHRVVLVAACPMLQSMENATSGSHLEVRLASDIKQDSINTFLQYLYEGFMILTEENCKDVEKIARLLQVDGVIKCCLDFTKCLNASSSMQFKYSFHDQTEFKHVRVSELLKVQEKQHKRPSESSRPSSPGSKRQRILRASSPPLDTAMQVGAQKTHDTERMTESYKNNASDPWERVPRLGSQGASSQGANLQPGVIDIREDSLELIQTEPPKDSGGGRSQEPRKVQSSVSISVASQHNTNADLRVINVDGSNDSSSKTPVSTSSARGQITVSPLTMYHDSPTSSSSSVDSSRLPSERLPVSVPPSKPSSDHERQIPPSVNLSDFPTPSGDSLSHVKQRSSESFTTSTPHRAPYPVSLSAASRPAPSSQTKPFAAGSASQAGMSHSFTEGMPSSGPRSQQPPVSSSVGKSDGVEGSTTEKSSDISSKPKPDETPSTSDMTPDISIVKVEAGGDTDVPENLGGLDMYVTAGGVSVTSQQQARPPEDEEMDPADFDLEEPPGDWSRDEISNEGSSISGDQSGSWYTGQFKDTSTGAEECEPKAGIYTSDVALRYKMIELIPGVPVYVHQYQYDKALDKIKINQKTGQHDGTPAARYLLGVFYTKTELVNATNRNIDAETKSSFVPLNKTILYAIEGSIKSEFQHVPPSVPSLSFVSEPQLTCIAYPSRERPVENRLQSSSNLTNYDLSVMSSLRHQMERIVKKCNICGKQFGSSSTLCRHKQMYHSNKVLPQCKLCGKRFASVSNLKTHEISHTDHRPYFCPACKKTYKYKHDLKNHRCQQSVYSQPGLRTSMIHDNNTDTQGLSFPSSLEHSMDSTQSEFKPLGIASDDTISEGNGHSCKLCLQTFTKEEDLYNHMQFHLRDGLLFCHACGRKFKSVEALRHHQVHYHRKKQWLHCKYCGKPFPFPHNLHVHELSHTNIKAYHCQVCNKSYKLKHHLKKHKCVFTSAETPSQET